MAAPPTRRDPPTPDDASAGLGAATLAQLVAAGAAVGPAAMGAVGRGALVGAGSLPAATAHAIAEAVERALDGFWMQQLAKARDRARTVIGEAFPSWTPSLVDKAVAEELAYEDAFRRKSRKRWARDLPAALAHSDPAERRRALQALLDRERRYAEQRYAAVIRRVHARVERERVRDASPLGAYWTMDPRLKTHTPGCVALAGQFWPWAVIDRVHPPVHASCGCRLWSLDDAVRRGWMRPDQVPDEADAVRRAQMLARRIAELHSDLGEAALRELSEAIAKDAAYDLRYPKGTAKGGQYRPRRGYDAGGLIKRHVRRDLRKLLEPPAHASLRDDRENRRVNGRSVSIPWATHWRGTVGGRRYFSPPQSTNVYEEHVPVPRRAAAGIVEDLKRKAAEIVTGRRSEALDSMRARLAKNEPPIAKGDPVDRLSLLPLLGFRRTATNQSSERGRPAVEDHFRSADGRLVTVRRGNAAEGYTDVLGATIEHATGPRAKALKRPPRTFEEFEADTAAYAQRLGELHGRVPGLTDVGEDPSLQDTAAYRDWDGMLRFGPDARAAVEAYAAARREHRQPTADEALGMYIAQATALHEASHAVNPEYEYQFDQPGRRWAEEALAEELATADVGKHLKETGQKAVLRWAADHPDHIQLEGNYHQPRIVLASALDRAGIAPEDREAYLRRLKFDVDPNERLDTLAADMAKHSGTGKDEELRQLAANLDNPNAAPAGAPWTALPALPPEAAELRAGDGPSITVVAQDAQTLGHHGPMTLRAGTRVNVDGEGNGRVMSLDPADGGWTAQVAYEDGNTGFIHGLGSDGYAPTELAIFPPERVNGIEEGARVAWTRPDGKETRGTLDRALLAYPGGGWAFEGVTEDGRRAVVTSSNTKGLRALTPAESSPGAVPRRDRADMRSRNAPSEAAGARLYHGAHTKFEGFETGQAAYLAPNPEQAGVFASRFGVLPSPDAKVITVDAAPGRAKDVSAAVDGAIAADGDPQEALDRELEKARGEGYRYATFDHPTGVEGLPDFRATVSLYPHQDLGVPLSAYGDREASPGRTPEFRDWNPGEWGKGLILPDGTLDKWATDKSGHPEHQDRADAQMAGDLWGSGVPVVITPDGFATVTDELYFNEPELRDEFSKGPATATGRAFYTAGEWFGDELPSYEDPDRPAWEAELDRRREAASSAVRGAGLKWEPSYDRWWQKRALPELDKWETGREGSPGSVGGARVENSPGRVAPGRPGGSPAATRPGDDAEYRIGTAAHAERLSPEETGALLAYTEDPRKMTPEQRATLAALVARHPLPEPVVAYRKAAPGELDGAKPGDAITEDRLRSASLGPTYGIGVTDDNGSMRLSLPAGTPAYYNPHNDSEHELILPPGLRLRVDSVAQSGGKPRVAATAVPPAPPVHGAVEDPPGERSPGAVPSAPPLRPEFVEMVRKRREEDAQGLERMANPRKWAHDRGMTDEQYEKAVADHVGGLARSADLVVRLDEKYLPAFLEGHVANQHEVDHSGGMYDPVRRARAEAGAWDIAGAEPDRGKIDYSSPAAEYAAEHPDRFPVYGYLSMGPDRPSPDESSGFYSPAEIGNNAGQYGGAKLVLRPEVKDRTYLFLGDSLGPIQDGVGVPSPALAPSPLSAQVDPLDYTSLGPDILHFEDPETAGDPAGTETSPWPYTEAEIFGGVRPGDVDHVELAEEPTGELAQQLEKAGVAWTVGQQGAPDTSVSTAVRRRAAAAAKIMGDAGAPYSEAVDEMGNWPITDADRADVLKDYPGAADHASVTAREESPGRVQRAVTPAERERLIRAAREAPPKKNWLGQKPHVSGVRRRGFGPTPLALLVSTGQPDMARYATPALGRLLVPGSYGQSDEDAAEGVPFAADNGGFWGVPEGDYKRMAEELSKGKTKPLWVTVPDVFVHPFLTHSGRRIWAANRRDAEREAGGRVREDKATPPHGDADATMARFEQWSQYLRHEGLPAAFVAQDGMDSPERLAWLDKHWGEIEAVFIGGSDEFKLGPGAAKVARLAHEHGKLVHVGRVNTHQRIAYARDVLGADSIDGGTFSKFKDTYLPSGLAYIPTAGAPPTKAGQEWVRSAREALDGEHAWPRPPGRDKPQWPRGFYPLAEAADAGTVGYQELADALSAAGLSDYLHLAFRPGAPGFTVKGTPAQRGWVAAYLGVEAPSGEQWPQLVLPGGDGEGELALAEAYVEGLHPRDRTGRWAPRPWQLNGPWRGAPQGGSTFASDRMARQAFRAPRLDPDQRAALERYRGDEYQEVNDALRGGREASPGRARDDVALMDAAVGASEAAEPVTLYRGLTHAHAIPERGEFVDRGFVSASLTENTATYFSGAAHGTEPHPDQTLAEIRLPAGAHALALAAEVGSAEGEVILPRGSAFRVVGRTTERWTTRSGAPASVTHVVLEYLGSRGGKGLSEARRAPQGASGRFFWAPGDVEPAELEEGLYDEHLHPRGRSGQWVRAFHGGGTNMPHASPVETAAWVEKRLGLPEGSVQNHRWLGFSRDRAHDPWSYWTTDRGMAERYAAIGSEPLDDALTAAYAVIRDIKPDQDTPDHWQRDLTAFKVKFLKDNGIEPHVTERRLTPEDVAASSNYQGYLKNVEASPAKDGKPPLSPEEWLAAANGTGEVTLMLPRADLPAHLADAVRQGGATLDLSTGEQPSEGFAVAVEGHSGITKTEEFLADPAGHYERWLEGNADAVDAAGHVGVWRDDAHGEVVLDPVEVFSPDRRAEAIAAGRGRDQQSIYDLKAGVEIPTGGTGGREDSPGRVPAKLYHSASRAYRESIRRRGILTRDPQGRSKAVEDGTPEGAYLFEHPEDAATSDMSAHGGAPGHDVWEVDARGLRIVADPASELPAWYSPDPIPPDRVRLHDARVPSVSSGWKMLAPGEYEHASGWHISRINYGHGDEWTAVTPDGYALDPLPTLKRARAAAELSIEDERGREQSPGSARDQRKREQAEAAAEWARLAPGDRFEVKSDGSSGPVAIAGYEVVRNDSDAYGPSLRVRDESGRETTFTPDLGSRPHMAGPADGRPFAKGEVVVRPNGKKASVLSVDGDRVTVVYRSGRSNGQQTFRASQLGRA